MAMTPSDIDQMHDLFAGVGEITTRKMFGGLGIYANGTIFAVKMSDGAVKLKGMGDMAQVFTDEGWQPWTYTRKDGAASSMPYWTMPDELLDDPEAASEWARRALDHL